MTTSIDLDQIARRPTKYWNADGIPELMMGFLWMLWGGAMAFGETLPRGATARNVYWMFTPAVLALSGFAATWATRKLKARLTFPRAGYVEWKEPTRAQRVVVAVVAMVAASVLVGLIVTSRASGLEHVAAPGVGVLLSLAFAIASLRQRAPHLLALAGIALVLGLAFAAAQAGWGAMNWMLITVGAAVTLVGAARLLVFLKRHPLEARA
jgi:hypothetical protein